MMTDDELRSLSDEQLSDLLYRLEAEEHRRQRKREKQAVKDALNLEQQA